MLATKQRKVPKADIRLGEFNNCEHLFVQLEPQEMATISVRLPNGKFVTFSFIPAAGEDFECVDIHATVGKHWKDDTTLGKDKWSHHLIGFTPGGGTTFDSRAEQPNPTCSTKPTTLATLLLGPGYYK